MFNQFLIVTLPYGNLCCVWRSLFTGDDCGSRSGVPNLFLINDHFYIILGSRDHYAGRYNKNLL